MFVNFGATSLRSEIEDDKQNIDVFLPKTGGVMSGLINMGNNKITNVHEPTDDGDVVTKSFLDKANQFEHIAIGETTLTQNENKKLLITSPGVIFKLAKAVTAKPPAVRETPAEPLELTLENVKINLPLYVKNSRIDALKVDSLKVDRLYVKSNIDKLYVEDLKVKESQIADLKVVVFEVKKSEVDYQKVEKSEIDDLTVKKSKIDDLSVDDLTVKKSKIDVLQVMKFLRIKYIEVDKLLVTDQLIFSGDIFNMRGKRIGNLGDPESDTDAVNKKYVVNFVNTLVKSEISNKPAAVILGDPNKFLKPMNTEGASRTEGVSRTEGASHNKRIELSGVENVRLSILRGKDNQYTVDKAGNRFFEGHNSQWVQLQYNCFNMNHNRIENVLTPIKEYDAANKRYVNLIEEKWKDKLKKLEQKHNQNLLALVKILVNNGTIKPKDLEQFNIILK